MILATVYSFIMRSSGKLIANTMRLFEKTLRTSDVGRLAILWKEVGSPGPVEEMSEREKIVWELIPPVADKAKLSEISNNAECTVPQFLEEMGYAVPFDRETVTNMGKWLSNEGESLDVSAKLLMAAAVFQTLSRLHVSKEPMSCEDFELLLGIACAVPKGTESYAILAFDCLVKADKGGVVWSRACVEKALEFFQEYRDKCTFPTFRAFVEQVMEMEDREAWTKVVILIDEWIQEGRKIVKDNAVEIIKCVSRMPEMIAAKDRSAVLLIVHSVAYLNDECEWYFDMVAEAYMNWADEACENIVAGKCEHVCDLPSKFSEKPEKEAKLIEGDEYKWHTLPPELVVHESEVKTNIPSIFGRENKMLSEFVQFLDDEKRDVFLICFAGKLQACNKQKKCRALTCFLVAFRALPMMLEICFDVLFEPELFSETETTYGPNKYDEMTNMYRKLVVHTFCSQAPELLKIMVERKSNCPLFLAELAARLSLEPTLDMNVLTDKVCVDALFDSLVNLRMIGADSMARTALLTFVFGYLKRKARIEGKLAITDIDFANCFLQLLYERQLVDVIFQVLCEFLQNVNDRDFETEEERSLLLIEMIQFLREYIVKAPEMKEKAFTFVSETVKMCPRFTFAFASFLRLMITELEETRSEIALNNAITLMAALSNLNDEFVLSEHAWKVLSENVSEQHYTMILNLIAGSVTVTKMSPLFLIERPQFIPLMFCALGKNEQKIAEFFSYLKLLVVNKSTYNAYKLHEGKVDEILLAWLKEGPSFVSNGATIEMHVDRKIVLEILEMIISVVCDSELAEQFLKAITGPQDKDIIHTLHRSGAKLRAMPVHEYPIGTLDPFAKIENFKATDIDGPFTVTFLLQTDESVLAGLPAIVDILSFSDNKGTTLSLCIINNSLCALCDGKRRKVLVPICQRMTSHSWCYFHVTFKNDPKRNKCMISTIIKDGELLHDSEFEIVKFESSSLTVCLGGYHFENRVSKLEGTICGHVANLCVYKSSIADEELWEIIGSLDAQLKNCLFAYTDLFGDKETGRKIIQMPAALKHSNILTALRSDNAIRLLTETYTKVKDQRLVALLQEVIDSTKDKELPVLLKDWLAKFPNEERNMHLYCMFFDVARTITSTEIRELWVEHVLMNCNLWDVNDTRLLSHWNTTLLSVFSETFKTKSYLADFLQDLTNLTPEAVKLLSRLGKMQLQERDVQALFQKCRHNMSNPATLKIYLRIMRCLADNIAEVGQIYADDILMFVEHEDIEVAAIAIESLATLMGSDFCLMIPKILAKQPNPSQDLIDRLISAAPGWPPLLILIFAILLAHSELTLSSNIPLLILDNPLKLWYVYPVLLYVKSDGPLREAVQTFLASNSCQFKEALDVLFFIMLVAENTDVAFQPVQDFASAIYQTVKLADHAEAVFWIMIIVGLYKIRPADYISFAHILESVQSGGNEFDFPIEKYEKAISVYSDTKTVKQFLDQTLFDMKITFEITVFGGTLPDGEFLKMAIEAAQTIPDNECLVQRTNYSRFIPGTLAPKTSDSFSDVAKCIQRFLDGNQGIQLDEFETNRKILKELSASVTEKFNLAKESFKSRLGDLFA